MSHGVGDVERAHVEVVGDRGDWDNNDNDNDNDETTGESIDVNNFFIHT